MKIPEAAFGQHGIVLGKTGAGKSYALRGFVEHLLDKGCRVCVIDPKGDWSGLRSGYPVVIFGGEHGDVPLNQHVGGQIAELIGTGNRPAIIDFGGWMVGERTRFWIDFASGLFKHNHGPMWLVIDEVHNFAPQGKVFDVDAGKCLHWTNRLASEGRGKGLRLWMASQRPQKVHKDCLTCAETLVAMRVVHPRDRDAIKEWVDGCGDPKYGTEILNSLAQMARGEGWVWSPEINFLERIKFPKIKTFDSFAAPTSEARTQPKGWAEIDLVEVRNRLAQVVEEAKANDPAELRREIARLKKEVSSKAAAAPAVSVPTPVLTKEQEKRLEQLVDWMERAVESGKESISELAGRLEAIHGEIQFFKGALSPLKKEGRLVPSERAVPVRLAAPPRLSPSANGNGDISRVGQKILNALAELELLSVSQPVREIVALMAGYTNLASTGYVKAVSELRTSGLVEYPSSDTIALSEDGRAHAQFPSAPRSSEEIQARVCDLIGGKASEILRPLIEAFPESCAREDVAGAAGYTNLASTGFVKATSKLRTLGFVEYPDSRSIRASKVLFLQA